MSEWQREFELTLAYAEGADAGSTVHILVFNDPAEIDFWDVANCGQSLGNWEVVDLRQHFPIQSAALCRTCFSEPAGPYAAR